MKNIEWERWFNMTMQTFLSIKRYKQQLKVFSALAVFSTIFVLIHYFSNKKEDVQSNAQVSDMIPPDFVMIPIELENHLAISSLIPSHGVVDLYKEVEDFSQPYRVAKAVRIIRSPADRFTVLIPENKAVEFVRTQSVFHAVIQNSRKNDSQITPIPLQKKRIITFKDSEE